MVASGSFTLRTLSLRSWCWQCAAAVPMRLEICNAQYPAYACARSNGSSCDGASEHPSCSRNLSQQFSYLHYGVGDGSFYSLILRVSCVSHIFCHQHLTSSHSPSEVKEHRIFIAIFASNDLILLCVFFLLLPDPSSCCQTRSDNIYLFSHLFQLVKCTLIESVTKKISWERKNRLSASHLGSI